LDIVADEGDRDAWPCLQYIHVIFFVKEARYVTLACILEGSTLDADEVVRFARLVRLSLEHEEREPEAPRGDFHVHFVREILKRKVARSRPVDHLSTLSVLDLFIRECSDWLIVFELLHGCKVYIIISKGLDQNIK
jgi:hypothetical protein